MTHYNSARKAFIKLGVVKDEDPASLFPPLSIEDTYRKSTISKRSLGDTRSIDGALWRLGSIGTSSKSIPHDTSSDSAAEDVNGPSKS
jgi:hypothetical protein